MPEILPQALSRGEVQSFNNPGESGFFGAVYHDQLSGKALVTSRGTELGIDERFGLGLFDAFPIDAEFIGFGEFAQGANNAGAVNLGHVGFRIKIQRVRRKIHLRHPIGFGHAFLRPKPESRNAGQGDDITAIAGFGELGDASGAADMFQGRRRLSDMRLDHADDAMRRQGVVNHLHIARFENIERQLSAWQQQRLQRKDRNFRWQVHCRAIGPVDAHAALMPSREQQGGQTPARLNGGGVHRSPGVEKLQQLFAGPAVFPGAVPFDDFEQGAGSLLTFAKPGKGDGAGQIRILLA